MIRFRMNFTTNTRTHIKKRQRHHQFKELGFGWILDNDGDYMTGLLKYSYLSWQTQKKNIRLFWISSNSLEWQQQKQQKLDRIVVNKQIKRSNRKANELFNSKWLKMNFFTFFLFLFVVYEIFVQKTTTTKKGFNTQFFLSLWISKSCPIGHDNNQKN